MTPLQSIAVLMAFAAAGGYVNHRWLKMPPVLGMTATSVGFALLLIGLGRTGSLPLEAITTLVRSFDFQSLVLHGMLALLLFSGALFVDVGALRRWAGPIASLATLGVLVTTGITGVLLWALTHAFGVAVPLIWCLVFGALIAPTDPIAALAVVRRMNAPKHLEMKLVGESLFNDGSGVMLFLILLGIAQTGAMDGSLLFTEIVWAPVVGALVGLGLGWFTLQALRGVDNYALEILLTLALACGAYGLAEAIHASAPIAVVLAGLVMGHKGRQQAMSDKTREHLDMFWETIDELLNAALFALIGLELLVIHPSWLPVFIGLGAWGCVLVGRWAGVVIPLVPFQARLKPGTVPVLVWGGLRGGISLALALSLPAGAISETLVVVTFVVVVLSSLGQGLTLGRVTRWATRRRPEPVDADPSDPRF